LVSHDTKGWWWVGGRGVAPTFPRAVAMAISASRALTPSNWHDEASWNEKIFHIGRTRPDDAFCMGVSLAETLAHPTNQVDLVSAGPRWAGCGQSITA
jgi:hypothetical protein